MELVLLELIVVEREVVVSLVWDKSEGGVFKGGLGELQE